MGCISSKKNKIFTVYWEIRKSNDFTKPNEFKKYIIEKNVPYLMPPSQNHILTNRKRIQIG